MLASAFDTLECKSTRTLRESIDAKLQQTVDDLERRSLCSQRNELAPISRLPTEILTRIIREIVMVVKRSGRKFKDVYGRHIIISWVCRRWRRTILGDHILWTDIRAHYWSYLPILLERSGGAPLSLKLGRLSGFPEHLVKNIMEVVPEQWHRIKFLDLYLNPSISPAFLFEPSLKLVHLELRYSSIVRDPPSTLLNGLAPCL
ncbi:hypothetical protein AX16_005811 [Volvariella volvacea WC 439]|nr:hypothetical protein AX16_005811 [Volvariella volvacea WC 439]